MAESPVDPAEAERLAEAERNLRAAQTQRIDRRSVAIVLAEYERRGAVEKAAAAFVMAGLCGSDQRAELAALIEAVRTNGEFRG